MEKLIPSFRKRQSENKNLPYWETDLIFTFESGRQKFRRINMKPCNNDKEFLTFAFLLLEKTEVVELIKISTCICCDDEKDIPMFLRCRNGKYFFNVEDNEDEDTFLNRKFKNLFTKDLPKVTKPIPKEVEEMSYAGLKMEKE